MKNYEWVKKQEARPERDKIEKNIRLVQKEVYDYFTFQYRIVGSAKRNMITCDYSSNTGYDFDYNIEPNCDFDKYSPEEIKRILRQAFDEIGKRHGYSSCEDSTRVITLKQYNSLLITNKTIIHSCDFAIVRKKGKQWQYIHYDKPMNRYYWENQPKDFEGLEEKEKYIKKKGKWNDVKNEYLYLKKNNMDQEKKSRSLYAEAVNNIHDQLNMK